jgi:hypothetical protein
MRVHNCPLGVTIGFLLISLSASVAFAGPAVPSKCNATASLVYENDTVGTPMNGANLNNLLKAIEDGRGLRVVFAFAAGTLEISFDVASVIVSTDHKVVAAQGNALYELNNLSTLTSSGTLIIPIVSTSGYYHGMPAGNLNRAYMCWYAS